MENPLKVFISYSHKDEKFIEEFKKHLAPLKNEGIIEEWYDRKIYPGDDWQQEIENNLKDADIILLFISADFLASSNCQKEKEMALDLMKSKGTRVIPIILSNCAWKDDKDLSQLQALPTDGKPVKSFKNREDAWVDVYKGLKSVLNKILKYKNIKSKENFKREFLQSAGEFTQAHSKKVNVLLEDIFIPPMLEVYDATADSQEVIQEPVIKFEKLISNFKDYGKIVIIGESQSGKTTLGKVLYQRLLEQGLIPIYLSIRKGERKTLSKWLSESFEKQYDSDVSFDELSEELIVPIIDNFHIYKWKDKLISELSKFKYSVLIVDDISSLMLSDAKYVYNYKAFKIKELNSTQRYELIRKWILLRDEEGEIDNNFYKKLDEMINLVNSTLGKIFGKGIMPSYPFFVLSIIIAYEAFSMPLNQEITSQGYCYQALIYIYLRKAGVKNDEIDMYINFLTELAYYLFKKEKVELYPEEFEEFYKEYDSKYNLPIKRQKLLNNLKQIFYKNNLGNFTFRYLYLYYYFVAKYLAEHIDNKEIWSIIQIMLKNLHVDKYAYILIFLVHHTKNLKILEKLEEEARSLFNQYPPATLNKHEVRFFDEKKELIIEAALPKEYVSPEEERKRMLELEDSLEELEEAETNENDTEFDKNFRRAIKTAEVMGCILRNRAGSLEKVKLEQLFLEAMNIYLRIISSFFNAIRNEENQEKIVEYISERLLLFLEKYDAEKIKKIEAEKLKEIARIIFWNLNFFLLLGLIYKTIQSLGSDKLSNIIKAVDEKVHTPASFLIKQGIFMWYNKNLRLNEFNRINEKDFSDIAKKIFKFMVVEYSRLHRLNYKEKEKIRKLLDIPKQYLLSIKISK